MRVAGKGHDAMKVMWLKNVYIVGFINIEPNNECFFCPAVMPVDDCPCVNGDCRVEGDHVFCLCHSGWIGPLCEQRMHACNILYSHLCN